MAIGLNLKRVENFNCEVCIMVKQTQNLFPKDHVNHTKNKLDLIHSDVCSPMRTQSIGQKKYFATFIDEKSNWTEVYFLKNKCDVKSAFQDFKAS